MASALDFSPTLDHILLIAAISEVQRRGDFLGERFCPIVPYNSMQIEFDIVMEAAGLLNAVGMDETIPEDRYPPVSTIKMEAPVHRGHYPIPESMLKRLRRPGTRETLMTLEEITARASEWMVRRAEATIEWSRWQMWAGTLNVKYNDGATEAVNYRMPPPLDVSRTGTAAWSDYTNADPLEDIALLEERLLEFGSEVGEWVYGWRVKRYLLQNAKIRALVQDSAGRDMMAQGVIPPGLLMGYPHQLYRRTYQARDFLGAAYTSGTTVTLEDGAVGQLSEIAAPDRVVFGPSSHANNPRAKESIEVVSLSGTTLTIHSDELSLDFAAGDPVTWHRPYVHPDHFWAMPMNDGERWCEFWNCPSIHNDDRPGIYAQSKIDIDDIPFRGWVKGGVDGIPAMFRQGRHGRITTDD